jgi:hypothetical protein
MTAEPLTLLRARLRKLFQEHDITGMTVSEVWRLTLESEVLDVTEVDEILHEAHVRLVARVLMGDPTLRRRVEIEGRAALEDPVVQARLQQLIEEHVEAGEESEDP